MKVSGNFSGSNDACYPFSIYDFPMRREKAIKAQFNRGNISDNELRTMIHNGLLDECELEDLGIPEEKIEDILTSDMESGTPANIIETVPAKKINKKFKKGALIAGIGIVALLFLKGR